MNAREREHLALCEIWKKAFAEKSITVTMSSKSAAIRLRFQLYSAAKRARLKQADDVGLMLACDECSVRLDGNLLTVYQRKFGDALANVLGQLGISPEGVKSEIELAAEDSLRKMVGPGAAAARNKYFNRGED